MQTTIHQFREKGFVKIDSLLTKTEVDELRQIYDALLADKLATQNLRSDLAGDNATNDSGVERITQIMRPSSVNQELHQHLVYQKTIQWAQDLLGPDMALDFDMLINKAPFTKTETPWHQDAAYWINMPDKRAVSFWIALDDVFPENGCMWFVPRAKEDTVYHHQNLPNGGALYCEYKGDQSQAISMKAGSCTAHDGFTLHYSRGNETNGSRRALILNYRPTSMIAYERQQGVDHTGQRKFKK
ncbi:phytanoyl-CoA dioxygenase family protein [Membranihabitans marinus]|uniref:phytanoyl-CoA dioxygenase family protein n=1 Tax=Membranihabitans marinus TaxID=1227546 RepID=UPI001F402F6D|nr:phytanoyl-CoA dioxygenase family protein [Membranihabitans marinus]